MVIGQSTGESLRRLKAEAAVVRQGWLPENWIKRTPTGDVALRMVPDTFLQHLPVGSFDDLCLVPGEEFFAYADLTLPDMLHGIPMAGETLELGINSVFPMEVSIDGRIVFSDDTPPVAAGPALFELIDTVQPGACSRIQVRLQAPKTQFGAAWTHFHFTTPGVRWRFDQLDLLASQIELASFLASSERDFSLLDELAHRIPEDLPGLSQRQLEELVISTQECLAPFAERMSAPRVHAVGHSHIDLAWLWTWDDTVEVIRRDVLSVLSLLDDYPEMTFTHSQPATYEVLRDLAPELFAKVLAHIASGRWEPACMQWVEADTNLASGEASVRQLVEGVAFSRDELSFRPAVQLAPDTFGHAGNLPQLAASAGAKIYYHYRANPGPVAADGMWPGYWWEGQDGSRILGVSTNTYVGELTAGDIVRALIDGALRVGHTTGLQFYGIGDHGGGPTRQSLDRMRWLSSIAAFPHLECSTISAYAAELVSSGAELPVHRGESSTLFEGCYTTHADTKKLNRDAESLLTSAETLAAVAGIDRRQELDGAWRKVLLHQFHDILDGSAIREAYVKNADDCLAATRMATAIITEAAALLAGEIAADTIAVTNPLGVDRKDVVVVAGHEGSETVALHGNHGHHTLGQQTETGLCFVAEVPALSTVTYQFVPHIVDHTAELTVFDTAPQAVQPDRYFTVQTRFFEAAIRKDCGIITSLVDRRVGRQLVGFGMRRNADYLDSARVDLALNVLTLLEEAPHGMAAWHHDEVCQERHLLEGATTTVVESGPVRVVLEVAHQIRSSTILQRLIFYRDLPRIDVETVLDWQEPGSPELGIPGLKAAFTASLPQVDAWFETPYAAVQRPSDGQESPALRWASVGGEDYSVSVLNDCKHGYDALGGRLRLSLVRTAYDPDEASDLGRHEFRYSLMPHPGDWRSAHVVDEAAGFNQPLIATICRSAAIKGPPQIWRPTIVSPSVRIGVLGRPKREDGRLIRLYESAGTNATATLTGLGPADSIREVTITQDPIRTYPIASGRLELEFTPWQVRTFVTKI